MYDQRNWPAAAAGNIIKKPWQELIEDIAIACTRHEKAIHTRGAQAYAGTIGMPSIAFVLLVLTVWLYKLTVLVSDTTP